MSLFASVLLSLYILALDVIFDPVDIFLYNLDSAIPFLLIILVVVITALVIRWFRKKK